MKQDTLKPIVILVVLILTSINPIKAQWTYSELNQLKTDVTISYDVICERNLTKQERKSKEYVRDISVTFNKKGILIEKKFYASAQTNRFAHLDYKREKAFYCTVSSNGGKVALQSNFRGPKKNAEINTNETKNIVGLTCNKATVSIKGISKEIFFTKKLGIKYCKKYNIDGFLLEYSDYNKKLGHYKVVAKKILYHNMAPSFFSLNGYNIISSQEYTALKNNAKEKIHEAKISKLEEKAPKFRAKSIKGNKILSKEMLGEIIVLNFWFTTCGPCKKEIPQLNKLKEKYNKQKVNFIAIALDPAYKIAAFLKENKFNYDIIPEGRYYKDKFDIPSYPTNIVIDQKGIIKMYETGYKNDIIERMSYEIEKALKI